VGQLTHYPAGQLVDKPSGHGDTERELTPVSNPSELLPAAAPALPRAKPRRLPFYFLALSILVYIIALFWGTHRGYGHLHMVLVGLQYLLILPAAAACLLGSGDDAKTGASLSGVHLSLAIALFALAAVPLSWYSARGLLNPDESGYAFQARIYRSGRIMAEPLPGVSQDFHETSDELWFTNHILRPFGWFPKYPPGWPLVLSLGYAVSAPWLLAPIFGTMQVLLLAACGGRAFCRPTGALAALMAILSPFYLINSIGVMSHAFCAVLVVSACLCLFRGLETGRLGYYAGMFAFLAATFQVRPFTGFVITLVFTAAALWLNREHRDRLLRVFGIGIVFGTIALAGVLAYNHLYSGHWLVSPYAMFAGSKLPPELSLNPGKIWQGIRQFAPQTIEETLIGTFPFAYLLAGYAVWRETQRRREIWILAAVYFALVLAYLAHPADSGGLPYGERFHFEAFFALMLLAARGLQLLAERWQTPRGKMVGVLILIAILQGAQQAATIHSIARRGEPYRKVRQAIASSGISGLVFLHDGPGFVAKHFNLNAADWRHAGRIYLVDAEPARRSQWACMYGFSTYTVVSYGSHRANFIAGRADCTDGTNQQSTQPQANRP
jgi:hypothetical protein